MIKLNEFLAVFDKSYGLTIKYDNTTIRIANSTITNIVLKIPPEMLHKHVERIQIVSKEENNNIPYDYIVLWLT